MIGDNTPHVSFYDPKTLKRVKSMTNVEILTISVTAYRGGDVSGYVLLTGESEDSKNFIESLNSRSYFARVGYGEVFPVAIGEVKDENDTGEVKRVEILGWKQYSEIIDVFPWNLAGLEEKSFSSEAKNTMHFFYGETSKGLICSILDNVKRTMNIRGYNSNVFDFSQMFSESAGGIGYANNIANSWRLNILSFTSLSQAISDVVEDSGNLLSISTNQDESSDFSFVLNYEKWNDSSDSIVSLSLYEMGDVSYTLDSNGKNSSYAFGSSSDTVGNTTIRTSKVSSNSPRIYNMSNIGDSKTLGANRSAKIVQNLTNETSYTGSLRFSSSKELSIGQKLNIPSSLWFESNTTARVSKKDIDGQKFTYDAVFSFSSTFKPKTPAQKALIAPIERVEKKAEVAASIRNGSGVR